MYTLYRVRLRCSALARVRKRTSSRANAFDLWAWRPFVASPHGELHPSANFAPFYSFLFPLECFPCLSLLPLYGLLFDQFLPLVSFLSQNSLFPPPAGTDVPHIGAGIAPALMLMFLGFFAICRVNAKRLSHPKQVISDLRREIQDFHHHRWPGAVKGITSAMGVP